MAHHRLGQSEDAKQALTKAHELMDNEAWPKVGTGKLGDGWHDVLITHILTLEAKALIAQAAAD
jgi:hypothetical protein